MRRHQPYDVDGCGKQRSYGDIQTVEYAVIETTGD